MTARLPLAWALLLGLGAGIGAEEPAEVTPLPRIECVRTMREARILESLERHDEALDRLRDAVRECPGRLEPMSELLAYDSRHPLADEERERLSKTVIGWLSDPEREIPPGTLGYLLGSPNLDVNRQSAILDAVLVRLDPESPDVQWLEAAAHLSLELERLAEARDLYGKLLAARPSRWLEMLCIELDRSLERWDDAAAGLKTLIDQGHAPAYIVLSYVDALGRLGRYEELIQQAGSFHAGQSEIEKQFVQPILHGLLRQAAWNLFDLGKLEESEKLFRRVLSENPQDPEAQAALLYFFSTEEEQLAHQAALDERWAAEEDPYALLERGATLLASGDAEGAMEPLRQGAAALPDNEIAWFNLGLAATKLELWQEAEQAFERATRLNPSRAATLLNRGSALSRLDRCEEAIPLLNRALEIQADLSQVHYYLYVCHRALGHGAEANEALGRYEATR